MRLVLPLLLLLTACDAAGPVVLNEFVASNAAGLVDEADATPDWVELYNPTAEDVALDGWFLSDDTSNPERHGLDGLSVPADGFLLLLASGDPRRGAHHLPFRLKAAGEEIVLLSPGGVADAIVYGAREPDVATARVPDGTGEWQNGTPTPGESNGEATQ